MTFSTRSHGTGRHIKGMLLGCASTVAMPFTATLAEAQALTPAPPLSLAESLLREFPSAPPTDCAEFSAAMKSFSAMASAVASAHEDERTACIAVIDSVRTVMLATTPDLQPLFAPVWSSTAISALRLDRRADARADLEQGVAALDAMVPVISHFMEDPERALEDLPAEEHCRILVTLMSSVAASRTLSSLTTKLIDDAGPANDVSRLRRIREDLAIREDWLRPVMDIVAKLFE